MEDVLCFATGTVEEPVLGFGIPPSIEFIEFKGSFLPEADVCINKLKLPRPSIEHPLLSPEKMHDLYDYAFSNKCYGKL